MPGGTARMPGSGWAMLPMAFTVTLFVRRNSRLYRVNRRMAYACIAEEYYKNLTEP
jgi:hypothetical protein